MSNLTVGDFVRTFEQMADGKLPYTKLIKVKKISQSGSGSHESGDGKAVKIVEPTAQQVQQAKFQIKHDLEESKHPTEGFPSQGIETFISKKGKKRKGASIPKKYKKKKSK